MKVMVNMPVAFKCITHAHVVWTVNNLPLNPQNVYHNGEVVVIFKVHKEHAGIYKCSAFHKNTNVSIFSALASLQIMGKFKKHATKAILPKLD